jgi:CheY-like chemotaxis protein
MAQILIAEDNDADRLLLGAVLEEAGHDLHFAEDGEEALTIYAKNPIDVVVTDIMMARKDGVELIMVLRKLNPDVAIIAVSGKGRTGLGFAELAGAQKIMAKPVDRDELIRAVREMTRDNHDGA